EYDNINPTNIKACQEVFFKNKKDPQFTYQGAGEHVDTMRAVLETIVLDDSPVGKLLDKKRKELILKIKLMQKVGTPLFSKASQKIYSPPSVSLVSKAYYILSHKITKQPDVYIKRVDTIKVLRGLFNHL